MKLPFVFYSILLEAKAKVLVRIQKPFTNED